jgi:hypothetical protein
MEATLAAISESKNADEVLAAVNAFLAGLDKADPVFHTLPVAISISSVQDIKTWLRELRSMVNTTTGGVISTGDTLSETYAVLRAALRKLEGI